MTTLVGRIGVLVGCLIFSGSMAGSSIATQASTSAGVFTTQACDNTYITSGPIVVNAPYNNNLKTKFAGIELGPNTGNETFLDFVAAALGGQGANLAARSTDLVNNQSKGVSNAVFSPFWGSYTAGMTVNQKTIISVAVSGQIVGYYFDSTGAKESCIAARTLVRTTWEHNITGRQTITENETEYHVFGNFQVAVRDDSDPSNVFPTAIGMKISSAVADSGGVSRRYKLWDNQTATSSTLRVRLARKKNPGGVWVDLPEPNPVYEVGPNDCVDMMFVDQPPEFLTFPPPFYCLGRCANPPLINTGY
jgi:hypothetical protein